MIPQERIANDFLEQRKTSNSKEINHDQRGCAFVKNKRAPSLVDDKKLTVTLVWIEAKGMLATTKIYYVRASW